MRWIVALFIVVPLALSFVPQLPTHGYGLVILGLLPLYAWKRPAQRPRLYAYAIALGLGALAWPDPDWGFLGWVLLLPYLWAREREDGTVWWRTAWFFGFMRSLAGFYWLGNIHFTAWIAVGVLSGIAFAAGFELVLRRATFMPYALRGATGWLLFEWIHSWIGGGFPWRYLAHTQHDYLVIIQIVAVGGVPLLSFVMAYSQLAAFEAWKKRRLVPSLRFAVLGIGLMLGYGGFRLSETRIAKGADAPQVLLVQTALPQSLKEAKFESASTVLRRLVERTQAGLEAYPDTRLVVWAETMYPAPLIEDDDGDRYRFRALARQLARRFGCDAIYGVNSFPDDADYEKRRGYNAAVHVSTDGTVGRIYRKQWLVSMGEEFLPRRFFPDAWCDSAMDFLAENVGYPRSSDLRKGEGPVTLDAGPGLRCAMSICFEGMSPAFTAESAREGDADLILNLVNNGWFGDTWQERQMVAIYQFRALETGLPFLSCANGGVSCAIAPNGKVVEALDKVMEPGVLSVSVPPRRTLPIFLRGGRWAVPGLLAAAAIGLFLANFRKRG